MAKAEAEMNPIINAMKYNNFEPSVDDDIDPDGHLENSESDEGWKHDEKIQEELENFRELIQGKNRNTVSNFKLQN